MQGKHSLHSFSVRDSPNREGSVQSDTATSNNDTAKKLNSFLIAFDNSSMHLHRIAHSKRGDVTLKLLSLNLFNDVHRIYLREKVDGLDSFTQNFCNRNDESGAGEPESTNLQPDL